MRITDVEAMVLDTGKDYANPAEAVEAHGVRFVSLIKISTDEMITGWSDVETQPHVGKAVVDVPSGGAVGFESLRAALLGEDPLERERLWQKMYRYLAYYGRQGAGMQMLSGVDIALWDIAGKAFRQPVCILLGARYRDRVPVYASTLFRPTPDAMRAAVADYLARGFRAIKMKVGRDRLAEDVERVRAMRAHLGEGFPLMVDANMRWSADQAIRAARAFAPYDPVWLEEPVVPEDVEGHVRVLREGGLPVAAGENLRSLWEFRALIAAGGVSFPEPDVTNCGGVTAFMKVARLAEAHNLPVTSHGAHDVTVHLLAACPNRSYLEAHGFGLDRYIAEPLKIEDGVALAQRRPGHGIVFDWTGLERIKA